MTGWERRADESARRHKERLALGLDYCAGCGEYVDASLVGSVSGFPICRPCANQWVRDVNARRHNGEV